MKPNSLLLAAIAQGEPKVTGNPNAFGLYTPDQVHGLHAPNPLIARDPATGKFTLTMDWKKSTDLSSFADFPAGAADVSVNPQGDIQFEFAAPDAAAFFRIDVE